MDRLGNQPSHPSVKLSIRLPLPICVSVLPCPLERPSLRSICVCAFVCLCICVCVSLCVGPPLSPLNLLTYLPAYIYWIPFRMVRFRLDFHGLQTFRKIRFISWHKTTSWEKKKKKKKWNRRRKTLTLIAHNNKEFFFFCENISQEIPWWLRDSWEEISCVNVCREELVKRTWEKNVFLDVFL